MANYNAVNRTKLEEGTKDNNWIDQGLVKSGIKVMSDTYLCEAVADSLTIGIATPPVGARIHLIAISTEGLGAGVNLSVGDEADFGRYFSGTDMSGEMQYSYIRFNGHQYQIGTNDGDDQMLCQVTGAEANGNFSVSVFYTN